MKTIERQIRNHQFVIQLHPIDEVGNESATDYVADEVYRIDGQRVSRNDFFAAIALLGADAPP